MTAHPPNHEAWLKVFEGLNALDTPQIQRVLGVPMLTAGRFKQEAAEYVINTYARVAERELMRAPKPRLRPGTLPKFYPTEESRGVRED